MFSLTFKNHRDILVCIFHTPGATGEESLEYQIADPNRLISAMGMKNWLKKVAESDYGVVPAQ